MLISRRIVLAGILCAPAVILRSSATFAGPMFEGIPHGQAPGDMGYKHAEYHPSYQRLFGDIGHCSCGDGECRVSDWRETMLHSPKGYDIIVERQWWPLLANVWMPDDPKLIPADLFRERAHVCAYGPSEGPTIACVLLNPTQI